MSEADETKDLEVIPKVKRTYKRQRFKKQFTVRIDEDLAKTVIARAEDEGLRFTDVMEYGLWLWARKQGVKMPSPRGRFLFEAASPEVQEEAVALMVLLRDEELGPDWKMFLRHVKEVLMNFRDSPRFEETLRKMAEGDEIPEEK